MPNISDKKQIAQTVKQGLGALITILAAILLFLLFSIGRDSWPFWLRVHQKQIEGAIGFAMILLILLSPIMIEATSNPRTLSGPGKNPKGPRLE